MRERFCCKMVYLNLSKSETFVIAGAEIPKYYNKKK